MASMLGCQLNFEVPLSILQAVCASQSGHQYEMSIDFHVNEFSPKHLKILGENKDNIFHFSIAENIEGWNLVSATQGLNQVWRCQVTTIQRIFTSKPTDDELLKPSSLGTTQAESMIKMEAASSCEEDVEEDICCNNFDDDVDHEGNDEGNETNKKSELAETDEEKESNDTRDATHIESEVTRMPKVNVKKVSAKTSQFTCSECNKSFSTIYSLRRHTQKMHNSTSKKQKNTSNKKKHYPKLTFSLKNSGHLFEKNLSLCKMQGISPKSSTGDETGCLLCGKLFSGSFRIGRHVTQKHLIPLERYWQLVSIDDPDQRKSLIDEILQEESKQREKKKLEKCGANACKCPGCGNLYSSRSNLIGHVRKRCPATTGDDAVTVQELLSQLETLSAQNYQPKMSHRGELTIICPYCSEPRVGRSIFKHLRVAHGSEENIQVRLAETEQVYKQVTRERENQKVIRRKEITKYPCTFCQRKFNNCTSRHYHVRHKCEKNPERSKCFFCPCGRRFSSQQSYDAHKRTDCCLRHTKYQCDACGNVYGSKIILYKHRRSAHDKVVNYVCPICQKGFYGKHERDKHLASHTDARPFQCEVCGKNYKTASDVKRHQKTVHDNNYPYHCNLCGHGVRKKSYLEAHKCGKVRRAQDKANESTEWNSSFAQDQNTENVDTHEEVINPFIPRAVKLELPL